MKARPFPDVDSPRFRNPRDTTSILLVIALLLIAWMTLRTLSVPSQAASLETPVPVTPWPTPATVPKVGQDGPILVIVATNTPSPPYLPKCPGTNGEACRWGDTVLPAWTPHPPPCGTVWAGETCTWRDPTATPLPLYTACPGTTDKPCQWATVTPPPQPTAPPMWPDCGTPLPGQVCITRATPTATATATRSAS